MDADAYVRVRELFIAAQEIAPDAQEDWLRDACDDPAVRAEVWSLLGHQDASPLLKSLAPDDPRQLEGEVIDGRYAILEHVAEGGFAHVYRARDGVEDQEVAIKIFKPGLSPGEREALASGFELEARLLTELSAKTDTIVGIHAVGRCSPALGDRIYLVLEWLDGRSLSQFLGENTQPWPLDRIIDLLGPVAEALGIAHTSGVAHRDIKPGNLFLTRTPTGNRVKLLDFGVAKVASERTRGFKSTAGKVTAFTVGYAAPEQISRRFGPTGPWTDVYALALVCCQMLVGRRPYVGDDVLAVMRQVQDRAVRPTPVRLGATVSAAIDRVFEKALAVEPGDRYQTIDDFWSALATAREARPTGGGLRRLLGGLFKR